MAYVQSIIGLRIKWSHGGASIYLVGQMSSSLRTYWRIVGRRLARFAALAPSQRQRVPFGVYGVLQLLLLDSALPVCLVHGRTDIGSLGIDKHLQGGTQMILCRMEQVKCGDPSRSRGRERERDINFWYIRIREKQYHLDW
jgi:hypothetical protein